jgi:hypothetical protein
VKLTTRGHYSVKAMLDLSLQPHYGPASVNAIAARQYLPAPYLEKLLIELRRAGLVKSIRGAQCGYQLAKSSVLWANRSNPYHPKSLMPVSLLTGLPSPSGVDSTKNSKPL